jgi:protein-tyrosine-phosphatase
MVVRILFVVCCFDEVSRVCWWVEVWNFDDPYDTTAEYEEQVYQQIKTKTKQLAKRLK